MRLFHTLRGQLSDREEGRIRVRQTGQHKAKRVKILLLVHAAQDLGGARFSGAGSRYGSLAKCRAEPAAVTGVLPSAGPSSVAQDR